MSVSGAVVREKVMRLCSHYAESGVRRRVDSMLTEGVLKTLRSN